MRKQFGGMMAVAAVMAIANAASAQLIISEISDGTLPSGLPKFVELTNTGCDPIDLSAYSIGNYNNGGPTLGGAASTVLSGMLAPGDSYVISYENGDSSGVGAFFDLYGFDPDNFDLGSFINGDDVIALFLGAATGDGSDATLVDVYGFVGVDGSGQTWDYTDGFSSRNANVTAGNAGTFVESEWTFGGANAHENSPTACGFDDVCEAANILANTDPGTHTFDAPTCGSPEVIVINEIMQNPAAVGDSDGEYFEVFNPGMADVDINGWTIADNDTDSHLIANGGPLNVPAGGFLVLGRSTDTLTNGGAPVAYAYGSDISLANSADEIVLFDGSMTEIDRVEYDGGPGFPDPSGASMQLRDPALDNNDAANWCEADTATYGDGDFGTPGAANDCSTATGACCRGGDPCTEGLESECVSFEGGVYQGDGTVCGSCPAPTNAEIRITEFMHGGFGEEFIEFTNVGAVAVDMTGWSFDDDSRTPTTQDLSAYGSVAPGESVILTEDDETAFRTAWGLAPTVKVIGMLDANLSGGGDEINLYDNSGALVDRLAYPADAADEISAWPCSGALGLNDFSQWVSSAVGDPQGSTTSTAGDVGNPGSYSDQACVFGACCDTISFTCEDSVVAHLCAAMSDEFTSGSDCMSVSCAPSALGACCFAGFCVDDAIQAECEADGGVYNGDNTECMTVLCAAGPAVVINEFRTDQGGGDDDEFFELFGPAGTSLDGLTYITIGDDSGDGSGDLGKRSGVVEAVVPLTGSVIPADGHFLAAETSPMVNLGAIADLIADMNFENGDNVSHLLVAGFTGAEGDILDTDRNGTLDVTPWAGILDAISVIETPNPPTDNANEWDYGFDGAGGQTGGIGPDGSFVPAQIFRCETGVGPFQIGTFDLDADDTPGEPNLCIECGNGILEMGEECDDGNADNTDACLDTCVNATCGDGFTQAGVEECDDSGESATCDDDCTAVVCGDGNTNTTAGETCDDAGESVSCDDDCTAVECGDGNTNETAGETCDDAGESATCDDDCTAVECGDGNTNMAAGEECDDSGESATCDADCSLAECGDGTLNATAGEACDDGAGNADIADACRTDCSLPACGDDIIDSGEECDDGAGNANAPDACRTNCRLPACGDSITDNGEACDEGGETATCDDDCTDPECGDGNTNEAAGEDCDDAGASSTCDDDCSAAVCGDGTLNLLAGEQCDDGNTDDGDTCNADCTLPGAAPVPAMSQWGMLLLSILLVVALGTKFRRNATTA